MNTHRITRTSFGLWVRCFVKLAHISPLELSYITHCWWHWRNVMKGNLMLMQIIDVHQKKHLVKGVARWKSHLPFSPLVTLTGACFSCFFGQWWFWHLLLLLHIFRNILVIFQFSILNILLQCTEHYKIFRNILWASGGTEDADVLQDSAAELNTTDLKLLHLNRVKCTKYTESLLGKGAK